MNYTLIYHKKTVKNRENLKSANLLEKAIKSCESLSNNPIPSSSKQLYHNLRGLRSIRINLQHRLVYEVLEEEKVIKILSMWGHYEQ